MGTTTASGRDSAQCIVANDVASTVSSLNGFLEPYRPLVERAEQREHLGVFIRGLLSDLERKSVEPIASRDGLPRRPLQTFVGAGQWDDVDVRAMVQSQVAHELGDPAGATPDMTSVNRRPAAGADIRARMALRRLDLKVGFACNNRCVFCAQGDKRAVCGAVPYARLLEQLVQARRECSAVVFTGGEPTVHKSLLALVRAARHLGYASIQIQTNGRMLAYREIVDRLVQAGATEFSPSLHGATAEVHDQLTCAEGSFAESLAGIENAVRSGAMVITNSVVTRYNHSTLPDLVALLAGLGVAQAQLAFVHPVGTARERFVDVVPRLSELVEPVGRARAIARAAGMTFVTEAVPLCFLPGMEELAVESMIPETTVVDLDGTLDYSQWRVREGKAHGPPCAGCAAARRCEGPWREYPEKYGWSEFVRLPA